MQSAARTLVYRFLTADEDENRRQETAIQEFVARHSELQAVTATETDPDRVAKFPLHEREGGALLSALQAGDHLIVYRLEDLGRSFADGIDVAYELSDKLQISVWPVDFVFPPPLDLSTPRGRGSLTAAKWFVDRQRDGISSATKQAMAKRKAKGRPTGPVEYGYTTVGPEKDRKIVEIPQEQGLMHFMFEFRRAGMSAAKIGRTLNELADQGSPEEQRRLLNRGKLWDARTVQRLLKRETELAKAEAEADALAEEQFFKPEAVPA